METIKDVVEEVKRQELRAKGSELQTQVRQHIDNAHVKDIAPPVPGSTQVH